MDENSKVTKIHSFKFEVNEYSEKAWKFLSWSQIIFSIIVIGCMIALQCLGWWFTCYTFGIPAALFMISAWFSGLKGRHVENRFWRVAMGISMTWAAGLSMGMVALAMSDMDHGGPGWYGIMLMVPKVVIAAVGIVEVIIAMSWAISYFRVRIQTEHFLINEMQVKGSTLPPKYQENEETAAEA